MSRQLKKLINVENINVYRNDIPISQLPTVQRFFVKDIQSKKEYNQSHGTLYDYVRRVELADKAFEGSVLSYVIYSENNWILSDLNKDFSDMKEKFYNSMESTYQEKNMYDLKLWNYLKQNYHHVPNDILPLSGTVNSPYGFTTDFTFKDGQYSSMDGLAHAGLLLSKAEDGSNILHVTFRGTEFSNLKKYIKGPYLNMQAYYSAFKPLEDAVLKFAQDPKNNVSKISLSGHSLGGAMVQEMLKHNADTEQYRFEGYTFGSPGARKTLISRFVNLGYRAMKGIYDFSLDKESPVRKDVRLHELYHSNDPIPKIGLLGYRKGGQTYNLFDHVYKDDKFTKTGETPSRLEKIPGIGKLITVIKTTFINAWAVRFHDSHRYIKNSQAVIENGYRNANIDMLPILQARTPVFNNYLKSDRDFVQLSIKHKAEFQDILRRQYPHYNEDEVDNLLLSYRENMKYESKKNVILASFGENKFYNQNFSNADKETVSAAIQRIESLKTAPSHIKVDSLGLKMR